MRCRPNASLAYLQQSKSDRESGAPQSDIHLEIGLNYCSQNGGKSERDPGYNLIDDIGTRVPALYGQAPHIDLAARTCIWVTNTGPVRENTSRVRTQL